MKKKIESPATKTPAQKVKKFEGLLSTQPPPTPGELATAVRDEPTLYDLNIMESLPINKQEQEGKPIIFSKTWYEFSHFAKVMNTHPNTVAKWLRKRWLAYAEVGKMRYINVADVEAMMLRFRKPALICLWYLGTIINDFSFAFEV
jgi:hypothetical protein